MHDEESHNMRESSAAEDARPATADDASETDATTRPRIGSPEHQHADELADEWGDESFPSSDPPGHY